MSTVPEPSDEVRDPKALRALAHPLRWQLIDLLGIEGSATATRCAQALRQSVASCSYHLNTLAKYGFVELSPGGQGREKPWRLTRLRHSWSGDEESADGGVAADLVSETFLNVELARLIDWHRRRDTEPQPWREATVTSGMTTFLTAIELRELGEALNELASRYLDRLDDRGSIPAGARAVRIFLATAVADQRL